MHILITGGAGFIGSHLAEYHLHRGDRVHVVDNLSTGSLDNVRLFTHHADYRFDQADILAWAGLQQAVGWADRIYHMAAIVGVKRVLEDPVRVMDTNMAGTERVLRAVHRGGWNPQVVIASSSEVYGFNAAGSFSEDDDVVLRSGGRLRWNYAVTKLADEFLAFSYVRKYGLSISIPRLFNTIGPRQVGHYGMVVPGFVRQAVRGEPITVYGDGSQTRSFCDVRDTVVALDRLASTPEAKGEIVNVGNDRSITVLDLANLVREMAGSDSPVVFTPDSEAYYRGFQGIRHRKPSLDKLERLVDFAPEYSLEDTIADLLAAARPAVQGAGATS